MLLFAGAFMFTLTATSDKIRDRMVREAPHTLDGMAYMSYARYWDKDLEMDLSQDALAIEWMQKNVKGSPVIVEANTSEYRWGSRYTIYTGLPGVVGWNWHQRQQRAVLANEEVQQRVDQVGDFYQSTGRIEVEKFLDRYDVRYIIVGQLEKAYYDPVGLMKFEAWNGDLWQEVYRDRDTVIYEVRDRGVQ